MPSATGKSQNINRSNQKSGKSTETGRFKELVWERLTLHKAIDAVEGPA